jgi:diadenosine tetraphosphatase ApaH/serine/threonine PP2A family protein phosphatase
VLADADREGASRVLCLGDIVGYGADPVACADVLGERDALMIAGNHEYGALGLMSLAWFNPAARAAALWTRRALTEPLRGYLASLPLTATVEDATLVHASPRRPEEWDYLLSAEDGFQVFGAFPTRLCFVGHTHRPAIWAIGSSGPAHRDGAGAWPLTVSLAAGRRYLINTGSVGQPRDGDPRAVYAVWDVAARTVSVRRVPYDTSAAAARILAAGLPRTLASRLASGR